MIAQKCFDIDRLRAFAESQCLINALTGHVISMSGNQQRSTVVRAVRAD